MQGAMNGLIGSAISGLGYLASNTKFIRTFGDNTGTESLSTWFSNRTKIGRIISDLVSGCGGNEMDALVAAEIIVFASLDLYQNPNANGNAANGGATFDELWNNYPSSHVLHPDKNGDDIFEGMHCAIDLSDGLFNSGVYLNGGNRCPGTCSSGYQHFTSAQQLADALNNGGYDVIKLTGSNFYNQIYGKQGIVFFQDYWHRNSDPLGFRTGDHIDLWNGSYLKSNGWMLTRLRLNFPNMMENFGLSSLFKSKAVWFWEF